ncbi:MAG: patatin-like phospholipase family protein [Clostridia bacterium]|nr:patatin-like phospholipase family protein [Clostridia bacterium]
MHIGLVLSGGMGKGAYQIGALQAINEFFKPSDFEYVSAASIGVLNTYAYLTNNLEKAKSLWESINLKGEKRFITSVLKSSFLQDVITALVSPDQIESNFYVPLLNLRSRELSYYNFKDIPPSDVDPYLRASVAMPFYNKGFTIGGKTLYDGAVVDNIPIYPVLKNDLDYVICVYFDDVNYIFEDYSADKKIIKLTFPDDKIISNSININHDAITYMLNEGYDRTKRILSEIFSDGVDNMDVIYQKIDRIDAPEKKKKIRITGDVVVTKMNKIVKKVVKHNRILDEVNPPEQA